MIVVNKEARIIHVGEGVVLMPGVNSPDAEAWATAKEQLPVIQYMLDDGALEEKALDVDQIGKLSPRAALKLVRDTVDEELLRRMRNADKRREVLDAIDKQIEAVQPTAPKREGSEAEADGETPEPDEGETPETPAEPQKRTRRRKAQPAETSAEE
jgi:hypothetical protein